MIRKIILTIVVLFVALGLHGANQLYEKRSYTFPVEDVKVSYSGTFGEMRSNHLHSGVDIRTDGVVGKHVVAVDDGYVSRISLSPGGFGLALYIAHSNGTTSVYAHLDRLTEEMESYLHSERYRLKQHSVNLYPTQNQFAVKRGELIAYSGNSGSSSGPHLHFEMRNSKLQKPLNPIKMGVIKPVDKIAPRIDMLYYIEVDDSKSGVERQQIQRHPLRRDKNGVYRITRSKEMWVGRKGYFVLATTERMEGSYSVYGLYSLDGRIDGKSFYRYVQDGFTFDMSRYVNGLSYYPLQIDTRGEVFQLRRQPGLPTTLFDHLTNDGYINVAEGAKRNVEIIATDHNGNQSVVKFTLRGKGQGDVFKSSEPAPKEVIAYDRETTFERKNLKVEFVKGGLYRNYEFKSKSYLGDVTLPAGVFRLGYIQSVLSRPIPLHRPMKISIKRKISDSLQRRAVIVHRNHKGDLSPLKSSYKDGMVTALSSSTGEFFIAIDRIAPTVALGSVDSEKITFIVKDNFSGVAKYSATLDGEWIALDRVKSTISHTFRSKERAKKLILKVEDLCGNSTEFAYKF